MGAEEASLNSAVDSIQSGVWVSGTIKQSTTLTHSDNATAPIPMPAGQVTAMLSLLVAAAKSSAFERCSKTVIDLSVRVAKE